MFKDLFSSQAATYSEIRPDYPLALYDFVCGLVEPRRTAWDCATGSGQAATALTQYFDHVIATDASAEQIKHARPHPKVEYRVATAEQSGLASASVQLVTVAQALHWFDRDRFYDEARRVLVPNGVIAVWSYGDPIILEAPTLDAALQQFNKGTLGAYWPTDRGLVGSHYRELPFPFEEISAPALVIERQWTLTELAQYARTWSSRTRYVAQHSVDPVSAFEASLEELWGGPAARHLVRWPLTVRVGKS